jgi:exodeoxyribonuclease V alpha subunit
LCPWHGCQFIQQKVQKGGKIDKDLSVVYWNDGKELKRKIYQTIISDIEEIRGEKLDPERIWEDFKILNQEDGKYSAEAFQIISPYRGEAFGTESINQLIQDVFNGSNKTNKGNLGGVSYFDKVIQYKNRPKSNPYWAYNMQTKSNEKVPVFIKEVVSVTQTKRLRKTKGGFNTREYASFNLTECLINSNITIINKLF